MTSELKGGGGQYHKFAVNSKDLADKEGGGPEG